MIKLISRKKSVVTDKENLEPLYTYKDFPVFFGCVDTDPREDLRADMCWAIDPDTGVIQLNKLIPLDVLYQAQHVDGTGPTWKQYYGDFADYIVDQQPVNVLEIGGGKGSLAENFINRTRETTWTIVEPNPLYNGGSKRIKVIPSFFDENFNYSGELDTIVFSQVLEHAYDPQAFMGALAKHLLIGQKLVFAYPNLELWLKRKYTNAINFEHTMLLTDYFVDHLLYKHGFRIADKTFYKDHSVFYTAEKIAFSGDFPVLKNKYDEYKQIFLDFVNYHKAIVRELNHKMMDFKGDVYLFGAHIFAQYLLEFGLEERRISYLLDNSLLKQEKRLYGTSLIVKSPEELRGKGEVAVILKVGVYRDEILKQLLEINPDIVVFE